MTLPEFLTQHYRPQSAKCYLRDIGLFLQALPNAQNADYSSILDYLQAQRKLQKPASLHRILQGIKKYYNYLVNEGIREDNPAQSISIKDSHRHLPLLPQSLLSGKELDEAWQWVLNKPCRYKLLIYRNISIMGLVLHQGISSGLLPCLLLEHLDMLKATIHLPSGSRSLARTLRLDSSQVLPFYEYLKDREQLLAEGKSDNNILFINKLGAVEKGETLHQLCAQLRPLFPGKNINPKTLRMSVIARQFDRGHSLSSVQYFAGHCYPDSTERYNLSALQQLQQEILLHHPLCGLI